MVILIKREVKLIKRLNKRKIVFLILMIIGSLMALVGIYFKGTNNLVSTMFSVFSIILFIISLIIILVNLKIVKR